MTLRNRAVIVGVGESDIGKLPHMTGLGLNAQAAKRALDDAGMKPSELDGLLTAYSFSEPYFMLGSVLARVPRDEAALLRVVGGRRRVAGGDAHSVLLQGP
jgi:3-oxoacyl-[acyl-carrier-protein] synthase III